MEIIIVVLCILPILLLILRRFKVLEDKILSNEKEFSKIEKAFRNIKEDLSYSTLNITTNHNTLKDEFIKENKHLKVRIESLEKIIKHQKTDIKTIRKKYQQLYNYVYKNKL